MSQAGFGDSSSQESISPSMPEPQTPIQSVSSNVLGEPTTLFNVLPRHVLEQELQFCNERSQQAQVLLRQAQEQLQLSQLVIQRQETLTQTLQSRIDQLENELQGVHSNCDELRDRLKRQQHHTSQLKAALERCLDTSTTVNNDIALSALESWSSAKLAEEKITPIEAVNDPHLQKVVKIKPASQLELEEPQELKPLITDLQQTELQQPQLADESEASQLSSHVNTQSKSQPISPLIVRPHRASQCSPIALNLPSLQVVAEPKDERVNQPKLETQAINSSKNIIEELLDATVSSNSSNASVTNSSVVNTIAIPKFMQALYSNPHSILPEIAEPEQLESARPNFRKAVTSLASVQLPQFPPLPRRR